MDDEKEHWAVFGRFLAEKRATAGRDHLGEVSPLSYRALAERTGYAISHGSLSLMEKGKRPPPRNPERLRALAKGLGNVSYRELMAAAGYGRAGADDMTDTELERNLDDWGLTERKIQEAMNYLRFLRDRAD